MTNGEESKTLEVFEAMHAGKEINYKNTAALNKIKSRIFEKSLDGLMMDEQYIAGHFSDTDRMYIKLQKQLLQCKLLRRNKGLSKKNVIQHLYNQIINDSKKLEFYILLQEALFLKKYDLAQQKNGIHALEKINIDIAFFDSCEKAVTNAMDHYFRIVMNGDFLQAYSQKETDIYIQKAIKQINLNYKKTGSQNVNYYLHIMQFAWCERQKKYSEAIHWCTSLIKLMQANKSIYRPERMGFVCDNLSMYYVYLSKFSEASKHVQKARKYFPADSFNNLIRTQQEFEVHFYAKKYTKASNCMKMLLKQSSTIIGEFRHAKYTYFKACLLFAQRKYKQALALLINPLTIEKDKERWNIAIRILITLIHIELGKPTEASRAVEALRKYIDRNKLNEKIRPRDLLIIQTLREMEKTNFEEFAQNSFVKKALRQLGTKNKNVSWEYYSAEMVPFHDWLLSKIK